MDITITPHKLSGNMQMIPSKSQAHRILICASLCNKETAIICPETSRDIDTTVACLCKLGAHIERNSFGYLVNPIQVLPENATLDCGESGSTLRFLLPVIGALGIEGTFILSDQLSKRPVDPLLDVMMQKGCSLSRPTANMIHCSGKLQCGVYSIRGDISSQFITGLLFALTLLEGSSDIHIIESLESEPYLLLTQQVLHAFGIDTSDYHVTGQQIYISPGEIVVEGDWSNGAFFIAANALGSNISIQNLAMNSMQGDRIICNLIQKLDQNATISLHNTPDLLPILAVIAANNHGATFTNLHRLRYKESNRIESVAKMIHSLGGTVDITDNSMTVYRASFRGGIIDSYNDHRIAMAAAIAATVSSGNVTIRNAECVEKSYPGFWDTYHNLGGAYE